MHISRLLSPEMTALAYDYAMLRMTRGQLDNDAFTGRQRCSKYADPLFETLLSHIRPRIEALTGRSLLPTYSYLRIYTRATDLPRHVDREACEFTLTVTLGYEAPSPWPICLESGGEAMCVELPPGDGLLLLGREVPHWREPFSGTHHAQVFFHFVDRDGPLAQWRYDRRPGTGFVSKVAAADPTPALDPVAADDEP
ncbi:hypothetical protein [Endothiovibrio diazotrophicus]